MTAHTAQPRASAVRLARPSAEHVYLLASVVLIGTVLVQMPLAQLRLDGGAFLVRPWDIAWLLVLAASVPLVVRHRPRSWSLQIATTPVGLFVAFTLLAALSLSWGYATFGSENFADCVVRAGRYFSVCLFGAVLMNIGSPKRRGLLVGAFLVSAALAALWATVAWATQDRIADDESGSVGVTRAGGPFGNFFADGTADVWWVGSAAPNNLGLWLALAAVVLIGSLAAALRMHERDWRRSGVEIILLGVVLTGLVATHSRESWLACFMGIVVVLWLQMAYARARLRRLALVAVPVAAIATVLLVPSLNARVAETFRPGTFAFETGPQARFDAWGDGLEWTLDRFPIGWGLGEIEENPQYFGSTTAENLVLQVAATVGIAGAVVLIFMMVAGIRDGYRRLRTVDRGPSAYFPFAFFVVFAVHGLFGNSLGDPTAQILLGLALGLVSGDLWWRSAER